MFFVLKFFKGLLSSFYKFIFSNLSSKEMTNVKGSLDPTRIKHTPLSLIEHTVNDFPTLCYVFARTLI